MLNEKFLLDSFYLSGNSIEEFTQVIEEISKATKFSKCNSTELTIMSYVDPTTPKASSNELEFFMLEPGRVPSANNHTFCIEKRKILKDRILAKGNFEPLIEEMQNSVGVLLYNGVKCFFVSEKVIAARLQPFGVNGDFLTERSFERDLLLAKLFGSKAMFRTLVTREYGGITKVFSILSERYRHLPQSILINIYDEIAKTGMGAVSCKKWEVTHFTSGLLIEFPEKAEEFQVLYGLPEKLVPGVFLETSDTGDCSITVKGTWRRNNSVSIHADIRKKHIGTLSMEKIINEVNEKIFSEYTKLPEALCELMSQDITDPTWDLSSARGISHNEKRIKSVLKAAFKSLKIVDAIGKKYEMQLFDQLAGEFDSSVAYTAYDFAVNLMGLPERISGLHPLIQEKLELAVARAPYIKYETTAAAPALILTA